jgi:hypothetical protein
MFVPYLDTQSTYYYYYYHHRHHPHYTNLKTTFSN